MLNEGRVLNYVKTNLGFPFMVLEKNDDEIIEYIQEFTLREFSLYQPEKGKKIVLNTQSAATKVHGIQNEYILNEPDGLEILNVVDVYSPTGDLLIHGHPPIGPLTHFQLREWALDVSMAMELKQFSSWDKTFEFRHPNIIRISPVISTEQYLTIEYERMQPPDFSGIPNELEGIFMEFALADIMVVLGRIRKRYADMKTPFGDIPISADIGDEGRDKKKELIDKLSVGSLPNVIIDFA